MKVELRKQSLVAVRSVCFALVVSGCYEGIGTVAGADSADSDGGGPAEGSAGASGHDDEGEGGSSTGEVPDDDSGETDGDGQATWAELVERCEASKVGPPMLRRLLRSELIATVQAAFPVLADWEAPALLPDPLSSLGFSTNAQLVIASPSFVENWGRAAEGVADRLVEGETLAQVAPCDLDEACVRQTLDTLGPALARRPFTAEEADEFVVFWQDVETTQGTTEAWRWLFAAVLQHPAVLYRSEVGVSDGDGIRRLTSAELADELAYTYAGGPPDAELRALAEAGQLADPEVRVQQATRLLATPEGQARTLLFLQQWLQTNGVAGVARDVEGFGDVSSAMAEEAQRLLAEVAIERNGDLAELYEAPYTFVNEPLAAFYGYPGVSGEGWTEVARDPSRGLGILATGAIAAGFAQSDKSSPTMRGLLVHRRLLCRDVPEPPDGIPAVEAPEDGEPKTTRQIWEENHANNELCQGCHRSFDPLGYAFEHYDQAGRYRLDEHGIAVDASGSTYFDGEERAFDGVAELAQVLASESRSADCMSGIFAHWAFAGAGGTNCLAEELRDAFVGGGISIQEYFAGLAGAPHFAERKE